MLSSRLIDGPSPSPPSAARSDVSKHEVTASITIPKLHVEMDYKVEGRLLVVPIVGFGAFKGNFSKSRVQFSTRFFFKGGSLLFFLTTSNWLSFSNDTADCKATIKGNAKIFNNKKGVKYLKLDKFRSKLAVGDTAFDIQNKDTRSAGIGKKRRQGRPARRPAHFGELRRAARTANASFLFLNFPPSTRSANY